MTLSDKLKLLATWRGAQEAPSTVALWDLKGGVLALLNDIDRALDYGNPGAGLDALLGSTSTPVNLDERRAA